MAIGSNAGQNYMHQHNLEKHIQNAAHIAWATGGLLVPEDLRQEYFQRGKQLL